MTTETTKPRTLEEIVARTRGVKTLSVVTVREMLREADANAYALGLAASRASPEEGRAAAIDEVEQALVALDRRGRKLSVAEALRLVRALRSPPPEPRGPRCDCCGHPPHDDRGACGHPEPLWHEGKCHCAGSTQRPHWRRCAAPPPEDSGARAFIGPTKIADDLISSLPTTEEFTDREEEFRDAIWRAFENGCISGAPASSKEGGR